MKMKKWIALLICMTVLFSNTIAFGADSQTTSNSTKEKTAAESAKYITDIESFVEQLYKCGLEDQQLTKDALTALLEKHPELEEEIIAGIFSNLDDYSQYMPKENYQSFYEAVSGAFGGIGVKVDNSPNGVVVFDVIENSPSEQAGMQSGDIITSVNGKDIRKLDVNVVVPMMRGEIGTKVNITVLREEKNISFTLVREEIKINPINYRIIEGKYGYFSLSDFNQNTATETQKALDYFDEHGIDKVILDLRFNPGGTIEQAQRMVGFFLPDRLPVTHIEYKDRSETLYTIGDKPKHKYQLAVLVNRYSASASELTAAALKDYGAGVIIGETTFGKGSMQQIFNLKSGAGIKLTIANFFSPKHFTIHKKGVVPNIIVKNDPVGEDQVVWHSLNAGKELSEHENIGSIQGLEDRLKELGYQLDTPDMKLDTKTIQAVSTFANEKKIAFDGKVVSADLLESIDHAARVKAGRLDKQLETAKFVLK